MKGSALAANADNARRLLARAEAAGGAEVLFDRGMARATVLGQQGEHDGMVRLLPAGQVAMTNSARRAGVPAPDPADADTLGLAMTAWLLDLTEGFYDEG